MHESARDEYGTLARTYLDTAGYGLPTRSTVDSLRAAVDAWQAGTADWVRDWDAAGDRARELVAPLLGAPAAEVALLPAVSVGAGVVLSTVDGEVLLPDDEFASVVLPALAAPRARVRRVPFDRLADEVRPGTAVVATSYVRSNDGRVQDLAAVAAAARSVGAKVLVDATHAAGILPVDPAGLGLDFVLVAAYKHLLCPRGVAFLRIAPEHWATVPAAVGSWRSAGSPYAHYYGPRLTDLAVNAARYDVSLAWHAWVGAEPALRFLGSVPAASRRDWCVGLADRLAKLLGLPATGSSILAIPVARADDARAALARERITVSGKGNLLRVSFHLYNDTSDADRVADVLEGNFR
jgi:selenocysteine lyase/cysteine desulfurase